METTPTRMFGSCITQAMAGEATTTRLGLQETAVSVYNTVPQTSYGRLPQESGQAMLLEAHVCIARSRASCSRALVLCETDW